LTAAIKIEVTEGVRRWLKKLHARKDGTLGNPRPKAELAARMRDLKLIEIVGDGWPKGAWSMKITPAGRELAEVVKSRARK
jgi:hypothetical protein